ncbi:flagellar biosynthesis protein FlhB [Neobacillus vireti]|uniref:Flagellar biosynthetic protein FlhB n=1 Tax=Neobacillus vireti LMG 21834 TaxID=1131730 RepID=A0AB94IQL1_9BACI|nr:flagellar biosynthesis protein FlhB [Neobacillus vireti]ETI69336.1 flagellar biosynthesis protein FlhB [Neobacillus vireti LMG 21834]KLT19835.1 flagellar biosynthesis protein FlhB [Neobacillus vireti]
MLLRLDLQLFSGEKTEKATPHKRRETRKKGQVAKSPEVSSALTLLLCFAFFMVGGKSLIAGCLNIFRHSYQEYLLWDFSIASTQLLFNLLLWDVVKLVAPIFGVVLVAGVIANYLQVGFMFNPESLKMNLGKLNPLQGFKRIFSLKSIVELIKSILKIVLTSSIAGMMIWEQKEELFSIGQKSLWDSSRFIGSLTIKIGIVTACILIILAAADYFYQKFEYEKKIRMSKQDIKDEYKKMEGDPFIKGKRRAKQRELSMNRMMQEVPKADVVITNPTHFAIAIRYDMETMDAPEVIAKGKDHIALKIKEIAKENKIMTVENKPLARALFAAVEIGGQIPEEMFNAVGEILAYVYYQENRYKGMIT